MYNDYGQIQRFFVKTFTAVTGALLPMTAWCGIAYIEWFYCVTSLKVAEASYVTIAIMDV
jgi:hypothetical protein